FVGFEPRVNGEAEYERISIGETGPHFIERAETMIRSDLMFFRCGVTCGRRLFREILHVIRPRRFRTHSLFGERFDSVAKKCAAVLLDRSFDRALVVVNKEPAQIDKLAAVLDLEKLERADERVCGA